MEEQGLNGAVFFLVLNTRLVQGFEALQEDQDMVQGKGGKPAVNSVLYLGKMALLFLRLASLPPFEICLIKFKGRDQDAT